MGGDPRWTAPVSAGSAAGPALSPVSSARVANTVRGGVSSPQIPGGGWKMGQGCWLKTSLGTALAVAVLLAAPPGAAAQQGTIRGIIESERTLRPLPGAYVELVGTDRADWQRRPAALDRLGY